MSFRELSRNLIYLHIGQFIIMHYHAPKKVTKKVGVFPLYSSYDSHSHFKWSIKKLEGKLCPEMNLSTFLNSKADFSEHKQYVLVKWVVRVSSSEICIFSPVNSLFFSMIEPLEDLCAPFLASRIFNIVVYLILSEDSPPPFSLFLARDTLRFNLPNVGHRVLIFPQLNASNMLTQYWYFH